ncbi:MAG: hypothetical protein NC395_00690 [Prevotella sp.]|nr:hypothetical protein [Prevotella sp.]
MSSFTKKYTDEEMNTALGKLLIGSESLETAVYCLFKDTGFFASNRNIITGYAGITDTGRLLCCKYGLIGDENAAYNMEDIVQIKIKPMILGQKIVTVVFEDGKKRTVKFQLAPKVAGSKLPNQERNTEKMLEILEAKQNKL